jgi:leucyl aminopeptidase (aminopeptidase T)
LSELSEKEMSDIARRFVAESMRVGRKPDGKFESVRILYNSTDPTCERFVLKVEEECWRIGAHTLLLWYSSGRRRLKYELAPEESLSQMNPFSEAIAKNADVMIFVGEEDDPNWARGISSKVKLTAPLRQRLRSIIDQRKVRWAYFGWPLPSTAKARNRRVEDFRRIFFNSIRQSFTGELVRLCDHYRRPILVDDGIISAEDMARGDVGVNIPAGEVFIAPLETTANGRVLFDRVAIPGFGELKGLDLEFKRGRIVKYAAEEGRKNFTNFLEANTGQKDRIAEFGIGCNRGAEYTGGSIIVDEKIFGTVHVAIGNNTGVYKGNNRASSHLDLIKNMSRGQVLVDGEVVMDRGRPVGQNPKKRLKKSPHIGVTPRCRTYKHQRSPASAS